MYKRQIYRRQGAATLRRYVCFTAGVYVSFLKFGHVHFICRFVVDVQSASFNSDSSCFCGKCVCIFCFGFLLIFPTFLLRKFLILNHDLDGNFDKSTGILVVLLRIFFCEKFNIRLHVTVPRIQKFYE